MAATFRNPIYQDLIQGFMDRMASLGQEFELLRTGEKFKAIAIPMPPVDPTLELGSDWRELLTLEARRDQIPSGLVLNDVLRQSNPPYNTRLFQKFPLLKLVRRDDNPASFAVKYWAIKVPEAEEVATYSMLGLEPPAPAA